MDEQFRQLIELGAGEFEHADGLLIAHLEGTRCLLKEWNASETLQQAGLYHAAYGTSAFTSEQFDLSKRQDVARIIGSEAEHIVYHYCACDRDSFFAQFGQVSRPLYFDRITAQSLQIPDKLLQQICELTVANEIEIAIHSRGFGVKQGSDLVELFGRMHNYLSASAKRKIHHVFASPP